jgi:hypothetical protein
MSFTPARSQLVSLQEAVFYGRAKVAGPRAAEPQVAPPVPKERDTRLSHSAIQKRHRLANELAVVLKNATMARVGKDAKCGIG